MQSERLTRARNSELGENWFINLGVAAFGVIIDFDAQEMHSPSYEKTCTEVLMESGSRQLYSGLRSIGAITQVRDAHESTLSSKTASENGCNRHHA